MADNEDQKDKALPGISAKPAVKPAVPVPPKVSASPASKAKPVAVAPKPAETAIPLVPPVAAKAPEPSVTPPVVPAKVAVAPVAGKASDIPSKLPVVAPAKKVAVAKPVVAKPAIKMAATKPAKVEVKPAPAPVAKPKPVEPVVPVKAAVAKPVIAIAEDEARAAPPFVSPPAIEPKAAPKAAPQDAAVFAGLFINFLLEEKTMTSANFAGFQDAITEAQAKAKAAFEKSTSALGEVSDFAKGNVEAVVESGKIFAEGVQGLGSELVAESRSAFEAMTGDIKELAAAKSPTDFFKLQSDLVRKNFDTAVANGSKNSEALLKLFSDTFAPISGRVSIAVEKARSAATPAAY